MIFLTSNGMNDYKLGMVERYLTSSCGTSISIHDTSLFKTTVRVTSIDKTSTVGTFYVCISFDIANKMASKCLRVMGITSKHAHYASINKLLSRD